MTKIAVILPILLLSRFAMAGELLLEGAWVRALPPTQPNTAAYLRVTNTGNSLLKVVGATADLAGRTEIHTSATVDGLVTMQHLPTLGIAPQSTTELAPGGKHLMLLDLERMPKPGESLQLCLLTDAGEKACTMASVAKGNPVDNHSHQHH